MEMKNQIQRLISENKIKDALDVFMGWAVEKNDGQLQSNLILIQSKLARLKQQENLGIIQFSDSLREQAIITNSILDFLSQMKDSGTTTGDVPPISIEDHRKTILFLASNPTQTAKLQLEKEYVRISIGIQESEKDLKLVSEWAIKPGDLQQAILKHRPNVIHFSGHGTAESTENDSDRDLGFPNEDKSGIIVQDSSGKPVLVNTSALASLFRTMKMLDGMDIEVVILNACHQELQAKAIAQFVPFVIGTNDAIDDNAAIEFSTGFYRGFSAVGSTVEFAFQLALNNIMLEGLEDSKVPVIYKGGKVLELPKN